MTNNFTVAFLPAYLMSTSYILRLYIPPNLKVKIGPTNRYAYCRTDLCINYSIPYGSAIVFLMVLRFLYLTMLVESIGRTL